MFAELILLRLEAAVRALKEAAPSAALPFVPIVPGTILHWTPRGPCGVPRRSRGNRGHASGGANNAA